MAEIADNSIDAQIPEVWSSAMQSLLRKSLIGVDIANTKYERDLSKGDTVHVPYHAELVSSEYVRGTEVDPQNLDATDDLVTVDTAREVSFYVDKLEKVQSKYGFKQYVKEAVYQLNDDIDQAILGEYSNASYTLDDGDFGGVDGDPLTVDADNAIKFFTKIKQTAGENNMKLNNLFVAVDFATAEVIEAEMTQNGFEVADSTLRNGMVDNIMGIDVYRTNNLDAGHCLAGEKGAISLVKQIAPSVQINKEPRLTGYTYIVYDLFGVDTLEKGTDRLINIEVSNSA